ncbi:MAG: hypothetical protein HQK73_04510, partial [Desulfamplus sp.]|nr:hypothetical protein [Desulfamplus sp.]
STDTLKHVIQFSVHCHNDLGMASANTVMGVKAGASAVEVSALGIGERNGIGDMFTVLKILKKQGYNFRLNIEDIEAFKEYYYYVSDICKNQTGESLLNYNTPFFGNGVKTHVAGTHAGSEFGLFPQKDNISYNECIRKKDSRNSNDCINKKDIKKIDACKKEEYLLNVLCGKQLVKKYLDSIDIEYLPEQLHNITEQIKSKSAELGSSLTKNDVIAIVKNYY